MTASGYMASSETALEEELLVWNSHRMQIAFLIPSSKLEVEELRRTSTNCGKLPSQVKHERLEVK